MIDAVLSWFDLSLIKFQESDIWLLYKIRANDDVWKYLWIKKISTQEDIILYYKEYIEWNNYYFVIMHNNTFDKIWFVWLKSYSKFNNNGSLVIFLDNSYIGKGYWYKSMRLFMKYCFEVINLHKLKLQVYSNNFPAIGLYKKLWFKEVWILREEVLFNNVYIDKIYMEIFKTEYLSI